MRRICKKCGCADFNVLITGPESHHLGLFGLRNFSGIELYCVKCGEVESFSIEYLGEYTKDEVTE